MNSLDELRKFASEQTRELQSPVLKRVMQIEEKLKKYLKNTDLKINDYRC